MSDLALIRAKFVGKYRANPAPWPNGIGAWYRAEDWAAGNDDDGDVLIATGEARARALDPWANMRAAGEVCPPLPAVELAKPGLSLISESHAVESGAESHESHAAESHGVESHGAEPWKGAGMSRATYFRRRNAERGGPA
jgi:hypothetical protein